MTSPLVVVVDMQTGFKTATDQGLVQRVDRGVKRRRAAGYVVVFLCFAGEGELTVARPEGTAIIWKDSEDGSRSLLSYIAGLGFLPRKIEFWGVNTLCCVLATCTGTAEKLDGSGMALPIEVNLRYCADGSKFSGISFTRAA